MVPISEQIMGDTERSIGIRNSIGSLRNRIDSTIDIYARSAPLFVQDELIPFLRQVLLLYIYRCIYVYMY